MIVHTIDFARPSIVFGAYIMVRRLVANTSFIVVVPCRVVLNNHVLPIQLIGQLSGHDRVLVVAEDPSTA
ncbi:hypothetical protein D3C72_2205150 [compost metagenome]